MSLLTAHAPILPIVRLHLKKKKKKKKKNEKKRTIKGLKNAVAGANVHC